MKLRDYQEEIINKTREAFKQGYKRILVTLPCGAGKTVCFSYMAHEHVKRGGKVWFLVHRKELVDQAKAIVGDDPNIYVGMIRSEKPFEPTMIILDEAHHSTAKSWQQVITNFCGFVIGLTATPCRLDGTPLGAIYQKLIIGVESEWLIQNGYLAPYDYYAPKNMIEDFNSESDNADFYWDNKIYGDVVKYINPNKKTIIYAPNIKFSQSIPGAIHFDGNTPKAERDRIIHDFRTGKIMCLSNVDLIGEGFDVPDCECVILLRPTMSTALYIQQSMRCMRPNGNKRAIIYDLVGNVFRFGMPTEHRNWSLNTAVRVRNRNAEPDVLVRECKHCYRVYKGTSPICPYCNFNNGKTRKQIEIEQQEELSRIEEVNKKNARREVGICRTLDELIELGKKRGYKNPFYWAKKIMEARDKV